MAGLSIGEVAHKTGLRTSTLRYYEEAGVLPAPSRINGRRVYGLEVIHFIRGLRFAQEAGFTLKEIKTLFHESGVQSTLGARWRSMARKKLVALDQLETRVVRMCHALELGLKCGCVRIEDCKLSADDVQLARKSSPGDTSC